MPPKEKKLVKAVKQAVRATVRKPAKPRARRAQNLLNLVKNVGKSDSERCAFQLLNADRSADTNDLIDAPVADSSPVHLFVTETSLTINAVNRTDLTKSYILIRAQAAPQNHILYGTAFDNTGAMTASSAANVEGYASLTGIYDDIRLCAMMMTVKDAGVEEKMNGTIKVCNLNPYSTAVTETVADDLPGFEYPPNKLHYSRTPWIPARPEVDHAFMSCTAGPSADSTGLLCYGTFAPIATGQATQRVRVYAIWSGRVLPTADFIASPKIYSVDVSLYEAVMQAELARAPLYSQARIMAKDDGGISGMIQDAQTAFGGGKKLFAADSSISDRLSGGIDLIRSIGSIGSTIAGFFGLEDRVVARLAGMSNAELRYAQLLLLPGRNPRGLACPEDHDIAELYDRRRYLRRNPTLRTPLVYSHTDMFEAFAPDAPVAQDWLLNVDDVKARLRAPASRLPALTKATQPPSPAPSDYPNARPAPLQALVRAGRI